jgi:DNA-binding MarR family transcriptional regulator
VPRTASPPDAAQVADRLHSAAIHLLRAVRPQDQALGIGPAQLSTLSVLVFGGPRSISALARAEQVRLPTMSRLVAALERGGLVTRATDRHDRRSAIVAATAQGRSVLRQGRERRVAELARRLESLTTTEHVLLERAAGLIDRIT